jgi:hypothetical protein
MSYTILLGALICITNLATAQEQPNPFKSIGKKSDVIDISKGKYVEIVLKDSLERMGSVIVNRYTRKINKLLDDDSITQNLLNSSVQSRFLSVDPLTQAYAELSPYQFASNRPIDGIDIDGKEWGQSITIGYDYGSGLTVMTSNVLRVKVINESKKITEPNVIRAKAELFAKSVEDKYTNFHAPLLLPSDLTTTEVVLDYTPASADDANIAYLYFDDRKTQTTSKTINNSNGSSITLTQTNLEAGATRGEINAFEMRIGITVDDKVVSNSDLRQTFQHEAGHSAGLNHPWELNADEIKLFPELNQNGNPHNNKGIIQNLLNSGENPNGNLRNNDGTVLSTGQLDYVNQRIKEKSLWSVEELKATPANQ